MESLPISVLRRNCNSINFLFFLHSTFLPANEYLKQNGFSETFLIIKTQFTGRFSKLGKKNSHVSPYNKLKRSFLNIQRHINWYQYQILVYGRWNDIKHFLLYKIYKIKMSSEKEPLSCYPFNNDIEYVVLKMNVRYILSWKIPLMRG